MKNLYKKFIKKRNSKKMWNNLFYNNSDEQIRVVDRKGNIIWYLNKNPKELYLSNKVKLTSLKFIFSGLYDNDNVIELCGSQKNGKTRLIISINVINNQVKVYACNKKFYSKAQFLSFYYLDV